MLEAPKAILSAITVSAQAVESLAQTVKNVADAGEGVSAKWKEHVIANVSFDDDAE